MLVLGLLNQHGIQRVNVEKVIKEFFVQSASLVILELELLNVINALLML